MPWSIDYRVGLSLVSSVIVACLITNLKRKRLPRPPGPTALSLLPTLLGLDKVDPWVTYTQWQAVYGDLIYVKLLNQNFIIINSEMTTKDLLEKRSRNYSDRPFIATLEPFGWAFNFAFYRYGDEWRACRRLFHQCFQAKAAMNLRPMQLSKARQLLDNLHDEPQNYVAHIATYSASIAMSAVYDYEVAPRGDPVVAILEKALYLGVKVMTPERAFILSVFPFLMRLPVWFPGATIKRDALLSRKHVSDMVETPFKYAQKNAASGTAAPSLVSGFLGGIESGDEARQFGKVLKYTSSTAFGGAWETTSSILQVFVLAMVLYPAVQERARAEIDAVVERDRLPNFDDRPSLPYIDAILRETLRWQPVAPLGVAHSASGDDVYEGYFIPRGSTIIANVWAMSFDERRYPNASEFVPERFLAPDGELTSDDPAGFVFGFGRRACPGRYTADASLWAAIAAMLATFEFWKDKDAQGQDVEFVPTFTNGLTRCPLPFPCRIISRPLDAALRVPTLPSPRHDQSVRQDFVESS
ncbi:cytochrome P450 [Leucogyrophana mollusca]|uniref:Cytochrome P450 n=1 Tax=Leucogyrophana mollusca TaxID=85980 RepID=A0ACB8BRF7_9AGAM|nr:cytochrome P450 [Leucogyrophana mollusca]